MTDPVHAIAENLIEAAYAIYGRPPEKGGVYIAKVAQQQDVPAYFRKKVALAREPRTRDLWHRLQNMALDDKGAAEFIVSGALKSLAHDAKLPADQRRVIEELQDLWEWQEKVHREIDAEQNPRKTPDWAGYAERTDPVDAIAEKLIEAAYELYGRPPEAGGEYIHTVTRETDVVGYLVKTLQFARGPRSPTSWQHFDEFLNGDAEMVMNAGLKYLSQLPKLPAGERRIIEEITDFQAWHLAVRQEMDDELNELAARNAGLDT
jgi:hypothetical protein